MSERVMQLGWPTSQIRVLGDDTGNSGSSLHGREDDQHMMEAVVTLKAGLICASELSRLIRDNQDWNQLVRVCRYKGVLLADEHKVYDAANPQDRVLLGIQGAFTEYELAMITERMQESRAQKAARGELYEAFPVGYICRHAPLFEKHPDPRVQRAVEHVFREFERFPSVLQLFRRLRTDEFQLPTVAHGKDWRDVEWKEPRYQQLVEMIRNPAYAGIYARGRCKTYTVLDNDGHAQKKRRRMPREQWDVFLEEHHEAYISKEVWERNIEKLFTNAHRRQTMSKQSPQNGNGLMVGLLRCRRCGHKLHAAYSNGRVSYVCRGGDAQRNTRGKSCFCFRATRIEERLAELIFAAISPAAITASKLAAEHLAAHRAQQRQLIVDRIDACREADSRAAREYKQTDETYTTVRRKLAQEWETALTTLHREQEELTRFDSQCPQMPTPVQQHRLDRLAKDVRRIWNHPKASMVLKKQIVRTLIEEIVVDLEKPQNEVVLAIHWAGGHHTILREPTHWKKQRGNSDDLKRTMSSLRKVMDDDAIATVLNRTRVRAADGATWTAETVTSFRRQHRIPEFSVDLKERQGWMTQAAAATWLDLSPMSMTRLVQLGIVPAEQPQKGMPTVIQQSDLALERVQRAVAELKQSGNRPLSHDPSQLKLFETRDL
jgi:DNA invertase Pin-like site-specific DNA recombinase